MMTVRPPDQGATIATELFRLTLAAKDAAEQGRWDLVGACYAQRGEQLEWVVLSTSELDRLVRLDGEIVQRIRLAQLALSSAIQETARTCRRLDWLRQGIGAPSLDSRTILLKA
ncbi:MAG TPA: hypothetical protein VFX10_06145 [Nitrospira sp.]|nr:hypothetical protein [Nitrospira sp.]